MRTLILLSVLCMARLASAQVIGPGHEAELMEALDRAPCGLSNVRIERDRIEAEYVCGTLVLLHESQAEDGDSVVGAFAVRGPESLRRAVEPQLVALDLWSVRARDSGNPHTLPVAFVFLLMLLAIRRSQKHEPLDRWALAAFTCSLAFVAGAAIAGSWGSLHEHNTFIARSDCALDWDCTSDRPGWMPSSYVLHGFLFHALPYRHATLSAISLTFTLIALTFFFGWLRQLGVGDRRAAIAVVLVALHPAIPRLAAGTTFWPLALALLFFALFLSERARDWRDETAAAAAWALALTSSLAFLLLAPLALVVAFRRVQDRWSLFRRSALALAAIAFVAWQALPIWQSSDGDLPLLETWLRQPLFSPAITPLGLIVLACLGVAVALWRSPLRPLPLLLLPALLLGNDLGTGYPTVFLHGFPLVFFYAALAATALTALPERTALWVAVAAAGTFLLPDASWEFRSRVGPLREELAFIESALPRLPEHERLVVAPNILEPLPGRQWAGDPVEVRFPRGFYQQAHSGTIMDFDQWQAAGAPIEGTLAYFGSSLWVFHPSEEGSGARPDLRRLRSEFRWRTIAETEIAADASPHVLPQPSGPTIPLSFAIPFATPEAP